ncbi:MAG: hypothetical protein WDA71_00510 [Actinomycetota bacterium]
MRLQFQLEQLATCWARALSQAKALAVVILALGVLSVACSDSTTHPTRAKSPDLTPAVSPTTPRSPLTAHRPAPPLSCIATVSNPTPRQDSEETVHVTRTASWARVTVTVHYESGDVVFQGTTDDQGSADISFRIGDAAPGHTVVVDVDVAGQAHCQTSFTPQLLTITAAQAKRG